MEETKRCPMCGEEILAVAKKCRFCGEYLEQGKPEPVSRKNKIVAIIAILVIIGVIIAACFADLNKDAAIMIFSVIGFIGFIVFIYIVSKICEIAKNTSRHK